MIHNFEDHGSRHTYLNTVIEVLGTLETVLRESAISDNLRKYVALQYHSLVDSLILIDMRYQFQTGVLRIDSTRSGLPNIVELSILGQMLPENNWRLDRIPPSRVLKEQWLEYVSQCKESSESHVKKLYERHFRELINEQTLYKRYCANGKCDSEHKVTTGDRERFSFLWSGYDPAREIPHCTNVEFEQDMKTIETECPMDESSSFGQFMPREGCYYRSMGIFGALMDDCFEFVHPKRLENFGLRRIVTHNTSPPDDRWGDALKKFDRSGSGFIAFFRHEIAESAGEAVIKKHLFRKNDVRERWYTPRTHQYLRKELLLLRQDFIVMPHEVAQHLNGSINSNRVTIIPL